MHSSTASHPRLTTAHALRALAKSGKTFAPLLHHGTLDVEIYRPVGVDLQTSHSRDELYVIISGRGTFFCAGDRREFEPGEVLFVPAGAEHRFENFSEDFATWVFFYGPQGGEAGHTPTSDAK